MAADEKFLQLLPQKHSGSELEDILIREDSNFKIIAKIDRCVSKITPAGSSKVVKYFKRNLFSFTDAKVKLPKLKLPKLDGDIIN